MAAFLLAAEWLLVAAVLLGAVPWLVASCLFVTASVSILKEHYRSCRPSFPRTAILVPAWNEAAVIGPAIDRLMALEYPPGAVRVVVIDDASTDGTWQVITEKAARYPGRIVALHREHGGEGKAANLNYGLRQVLRDSWAEAILITDADVIYEPAALRMLARHLADPAVGAVTGYIREGSRPGNYVSRSVAYEYIIGQAVARRSQQVLGALACLAGGMQLHSRASLEGIGGQLDTTTLAEDTVTTLQTQLAGQRVIFEPHATVWAEEPGSIEGLWRQRLRWARGNIQVTRKFRGIWFRPRAGRLGSAAFGMLWFSLLAQPLIMICSSAALVTLDLVRYPLAFRVFAVLWLTNVGSFFFNATFALITDPETGRRTVGEALLYPGLVNLGVLTAAIVTAPLRQAWLDLLAAAGLHDSAAWGRGLVLFLAVWQSANMAVAYLALLAERHGLRLISRVLLLLCGYGAVLCAVGLAALAKEVTGAEAHWEKTEKTGRMAAPA